MNPSKIRENLIPFITVCIWGSLYIASGIVLKSIPAFLLLFFRFSSSSIILLLIGRKGWVKIKKEDRKLFIFVGFLGYYLSNGALTLGIQYAGGTFSSLLNAMCPILITVFAVIILKETITQRQIVALLLSVAGAAVIIGLPSGNPSVFGIVCGVFSLFSWSFVTIYIRKLTAKYPALQVTGVGMAVAAFLDIPTLAIYLKASHSVVSFPPSLIFPTLYICLICTALSHCMWNYALGKLGATHCAAFYPLQPLVSMVLGILLLGEKITIPFLIGMVLIIAGMMIHSKSNR